MYQRVHGGLVLEDGDLGEAGDPGRGDVADVDEVSQSRKLVARSGVRGLIHTTSSPVVARPVRMPWLGRGCRRKQKAVEPGRGTGTAPSASNSATTSSVPSEIRMGSSVRPGRQFVHQVARTSSGSRDNSPAARSAPCVSDPSKSSRYSLGVSRSSTGQHATAARHGRRRQISSRAGFQRISQR